MRASEFVQEGTQPWQIPARDSKEFQDSAAFLYGLMKAVPITKGTTTAPKPTTPNAATSGTTTSTESKMDEATGTNFKNNQYAKPTSAKYDSQGNYIKKTPQLKKIVAIDNPYKENIFNALIKRSSGFLDYGTLDRIVNSQPNPEAFLNPNVKPPDQIEADLKIFTPLVTNQWYANRKEKATTPTSNANTMASRIEDQLAALVGVHPRRGPDFFEALSRILRDNSKSDKLKNDIQALLSRRT